MRLGSGFVATLDGFGRGGLWADHVLGVLCEYPFLRVMPLAVSPLRRVTFPDAEK
jgi:hypothetical protein